MNLSNYSRKDLEAVASEYHNSKNKLLSDMAVNAAYEINVIDDIEALNMALVILNCQPSDNRVQALINKLKDACQGEVAIQDMPDKYIRESFQIEGKDEYTVIPRGSYAEIVSQPRLSETSSSGIEIDVMLKGSKFTIDAGLLCDYESL